MTRGGQDRKTRAAASLPEIPDKLYFRIGEVGRMLDVPAYVLRFWETEFPHLKPNKGGTGQRLYRRRDVDALLEVRRLLYDEGYTIPGARQFLKDRVRSAPPAEVPAGLLPVEPGAAAAKLKEVQRQLQEIARLLDGPVSPARVPAAPRGPHLLPKKRNPQDTSPSLFASFPEDGE